MCLSPIQIINPSKYVSLRYRDPFLMSVPCGHCKECQQSHSNQWFFRSWIECKDIVAYNGNSFILFDTLTYAPQYLPHMDDLLPELPHVSCFNPHHLRNFIEALRLSLKRKYGSEFRYFVSSEYGKMEYTNRPHYHLLLYVYGEVQPIQLSAMISEQWKFGRTDGVPWKPNAYVLGHNVLDKQLLPASYLRACRYVTKYVQKSCIYQSTLNKRLDLAMSAIASKMGDDWLDSIEAYHLRKRLKARLNQFHRQSQHYGESYLSELDLNELYKHGCLFMPSPKGVKIPIPLPTYYKRKLFYELVEIDGTKSWQLNDLGREYKSIRHDKLVHDLSNSFYGVCETFHLDIDLSECYNLAEYVYDYQGRIKADAPSQSLGDRLESLDLYNYVTRTDYEQFGKRGLTTVYHGNSSNGYTQDYLSFSMSLRDFIGQHVIKDDDKEAKLALIYDKLTDICHGQQRGYELGQRLEQLYKSIRFSL